MNRAEERVLWTGQAGVLPRPRLRRILPLAAVTTILAVDVAIVIDAFLLAHWLRFVAPDDLVAALGFAAYVRISVIVSGIVVLLFAAHGLYDIDRPPAWPRRSYVIVSAISIALVLSVTQSFFFGETGYSRLWFAAGWAFSVIALVFWRLLAERMYALSRRVLLPARRVVIVGANAQAIDAAAELPEGAELVGYVDNGADVALDHPLLAPIAQLEGVVHDHAVDELLIALPLGRREQVTRVITRGFRHPVQVRFAPELAEILPRRFDLKRVGHTQYIEFMPVAPVSSLKRLSDLAFGALAVVMLSPILLAVAIAIRLDSPGPILYRQIRVGKDGVWFEMVKFRSMVADAERLRDTLADRNEASGPMFKIRLDPRVTRLGRFLRRTSLDELPQLINVLRGEMSLVGPRPPTPDEVERYEDWQVGRLRARPGITGLWQVSGRTDVPFGDMVRLDLHYIRNWSVWLDIEIMLRTIPAVLSSRGAY